MSAASAPHAPRRLLVEIVLLGLLASALFSSTWIFNRAVSLSGGHWAWNAVLRYAIVLAIALLWLLARRGPRFVGQTLALFGRHAVFWVVTGTIGAGVFYTGVVYGAEHVPGWVIAASWQVTILFTPLVLLAFGFRVPLRGLLFAALIVAGIALANLDALLTGFTWRQVALGIAPILVGAVAYPLGNQLLATARGGGGRFVPDLGDDVLKDPFACVFLMALGSTPFWEVLLLLTRPPPPTAEQALAIAVVAVSSGAIGTAIFLYARNRSRDPYAVAAVDATQAGEVPFTVLGEVVILGAAWPQPLGWAGILLVIGGLVGLTLRSGAPAKGKT